MKIIVTKEIDKNGYVLFSIDTDERNEMSSSFIEDVNDTYSWCSQLVANYVFGLLEKENPKNEKI